MEKLTAEILCKYPNSRIIFDGKKWLLCAIFLGHKTIHISQRVFDKVPDRLYVETVSISACQLILKPLDEISDEDAIEVAKLNEVYIEDERMIYVGAGIALYHICEITPWGNDHPFDCVATRDLITRCAGIYLKQIIDFLRSRSYDVDGLIERGIAVKA